MLIAWLEGAPKLGRNGRATQASNMRLAINSAVDNEGGEAQTDAGYLLPVHNPDLVDWPADPGGETKMLLALRTQKAVLWWSIVFGVIFFIVLRFNLNGLPLPSPHWTAAEIAKHYSEHGSTIRLGAMVAAWTGAFVMLYGIVLTLQMYRHEKGRPPIWTFMAGLGWGIITITFALPMTFFGVAAYTPERAPEVTALMHELAVLTFWTSNQWTMFCLVPIIAVCLTPNSVKHSPFPRWFGYFTIFASLILELSSLCFITRSGPFAWNGVLTYWSVLIVFGIWMIVAYVLLFKAINAQMRDAETAPTPVAVSAI